jgi:hypothetical protein
VPDQCWRSVLLHRQRPGQRLHRNSFDRAIGPNYAYDEDGVFESGFITLPGTGWRTGNSGSAATRVPTGGMQNSLSRRQVEDENVVADYGLNFRYTPNETWQFNFDAQYVSATHDTLDVSVFGSNFSDQEVDLTGNLPDVVSHKPLTLSATWAAPNPTMRSQTDEQYFTDRQWTFWRAAMDHIEHSEGDEVASQFDGAYNFNDEAASSSGSSSAPAMPIATRPSATPPTIGARSAKSGRAPRCSWIRPAPTAPNSTISTIISVATRLAPIGGYYYNRDLIGGYVDAGNFFKGLNDYWHQVNGAGATNRWVPLRERAGALTTGTDFLPSEIQEVSETNIAAYAMLSFGGEEPLFGDVRVSGNIGLRYVNTQLDSLGSVSVPARPRSAFRIPSPCAALPFRRRRRPRRRRRRRCLAVCAVSARPAMPPSRPGRAPARPWPTSRKTIMTISCRA